MKKSNIVLIVLAIAVVVALVIVLTRPSYAFVIKNNGQEVKSVDIVAAVPDYVCGVYNSTCNRVSNTSLGNNNESVVMVYKKFPVSSNNLNKSFLDSICSKINLTSWQCGEDYIIQEIRK